MAKDNLSETGQSKLQEIKEKTQSTKGDSGGSGLIESAEGSGLDPDEPIIQTESAGATSEEEEPTSDESSEDSGSEEGEISSEEELELSADDLIQKASSGDLGDSERSTLQEAIEAYNNRQKWQKNLTQKSQRVSQKEQEVEEMLQFKNWLSQQPPDIQDHIVEEINKAKRGELQAANQSSLSEEIELPEKFQEDEETKELFDTMIGKFEDRINRLEQRNNQLRNQLSQVSQPQQREPDQMDPQIQKEVSSLSGELDQLREKYPALEGPNGEEMVDKVIDYATEQAQKGREIDLEQSFMALFPEVAKESIQKSARESMLNDKASNGTVIEDTGEEDQGGSDQSGGLASKIRENQKASSRTSRSELRDAISDMWNG